MPIQIKVCCKCRPVQFAIKPACKKNKTTYYYALCEGHSFDEKNRPNYIFISENEFRKIVGWPIRPDSL